MIKAGDSKSWFHCRRRAWYDHNPPAGLDERVDAFDRLIMEAGQAHERRVLAQLENQFGPAQEARSAVHTRELIDSGTALIFQPRFTAPDIGLEGWPDFLIRQHGGRYQVADAKFAFSLAGHLEIRTQLALYARLAGSDLPVLAYLGNGQVESVDSATDFTRAERFLSEFSAELDSPRPPYAAFSESKCAACPYDPVCRPAFEQAGELTLVYGVNERAAEALRAIGIGDIASLADAEAADLPDLPYLKGAKKYRAIAQARAQLHGEVIPLERPDLPDGTWIHFDLESNPLSEIEGGEVYLWGLLSPPYRGDDYWRAWSDGGQAADEEAWRAFVKKLGQMRAAAPDLKLIHYSPFELTQIKLYAQRYRMETHPVVVWLLGPDSPLHDLAPDVRQGFALPLPGYGLKPVCKHPGLVNFHWELEESGSQWSVVRYAEFRNTEDPRQRAEIRAEIESYNRDDVRATRALECWLRRLIAESWPERNA
ncbi:MAG: TM0106 family RecB-like putative nuclease [Wenzhouxiangellaceae bacterium]